MASFFTAPRLEWLRSLPGASCSESGPTGSRHLLSIHGNKPDVRMCVLPVARRCCFAVGGQDCRGAKKPDNGGLKVDPVERQSLFTQVPQYLFFVQHGTVRPNEHITLPNKSLPARHSPAAAAL